MFTDRTTHGSEVLPKRGHIFWYWSRTKVQLGDLQQNTCELDFGFSDTLRADRFHGNQMIRPSEFKAAPKCPERLQRSRQRLQIRMNHVWRPERWLRMKPCMEVWRMKQTEEKLEPELGLRIWGPNLGSLTDASMQLLWFSHWSFHLNINQPQQWPSPPPYSWDYPHQGWAVPVSAWFPRIFALLLTWFRCDQPIKTCQSRECWKTCRNRALCINSDLDRSEMITADSGNPTDTNLENILELKLLDSRRLTIVPSRLTL